MTPEIAIAIIGAVGLTLGALIGALPSLVAPLINRKNKRAAREAQIEKTKTEITEKVLALTHEQLAQMENEITDLKLERSNCNQKITALANELELEKAKRHQYRLGVFVLIRQLQQLGIEPEWRPGDEI